LYVLADIDVDVILKCNKVKKLTEQPKDIVKALEKSTLLSVTEDGKHIFRTVPVAPVTNADECTIYVVSVSVCACRRAPFWFQPSTDSIRLQEDLPLEVDHDWLKSVFSNYGEIVYVSIPHYKTSRKLKGFAFIQFDSPESANKALEVSSSPKSQKNLRFIYLYLLILQAFRSANSCLSNSMEPKDLLSVQTFEGEKDVVAPPMEDVAIDQIQCANVKQEPDEEPPAKKRKRRSTDESNGSEKSGQQQCDSKPTTTANVSSQVSLKKKNKKLKQDPDCVKAEAVESETDKPKTEGT
jgi:La-related protein 7